MMLKNWKMTETLANGYSSERAQQELPNEYQHDRIWMVFKNLLTKVVSALRELIFASHPLLTLSVLDDTSMSSNYRLPLLLSCHACLLTSINQDLIKQVQQNNLRIGEINISPILTCLSLSDWQRNSFKMKWSEEKRMNDGLLFIAHRPLPKQLSLSKRPKITFKIKQR